MIEIDYPNKGKIYCPACGKLILDLGEAAIITDCPHVEFLGTDEGPEVEIHASAGSFGAWASVDSLTLTANTASCDVEIFAAMT